MWVSLICWLAFRLHVQRTLLHKWLGLRWYTAERIFLLGDCLRILVRPHLVDAWPSALVRAMWLIQWRAHYKKEGPLLAAWVCTAAEAWFQQQNPFALIANIILFIF
jgi:hypothetical protein